MDRWTDWPGVQHDDESEQPVSDAGRLAWGDVAGLMIESTADSDVLTEVLVPLVSAGRADELARMLMAAVQIGSELLKREHAANGGEVGPTLDYLAAVRRTVPDMPTPE